MTKNDRVLWSVLGSNRLWRFGLRIRGDVRKFLLFLLQFPYETIAESKLAYVVVLQDRSWMWTLFDVVEAQRYIFVTAGIAFD